VEGKKERLEIQAVKNSARFLHRPSPDRYLADF